MLRSQRRGRDPPCWLSEKEPLVGKRRVNFQRCWLPVSRIGLHRRGVERVNCGPKLLDLGEKGVYSSYTCRVPGGDYEGYVDAHVRRLEALRRAGIVERIDADQWRIPDDLVSRAAAHDAGRDSQASVRVLSPVDLNKQIGSDGATWLDRRNLLAILREREVAGVGSDMALSKGLPFRAATDGESVSGKFTGTVHLSSGKFAVVEKSHEFTLVPWRPIIDRQLGREVMSIVQGGSVSWQLGRQRGLER
ncbi:DUF3363 domain-containing protein [Shewanella sp. JNE10-2]|uniref:DUF3363 domain-containing protein n=1 Tax=unclassified Shewanella TaxID=196818 RepID=UPI0020065245|nr:MULTISPECIES: DUF3363 domain-containing protein [unclassified Shewanella]UPO27227.1 DUF3363 domain-containing protein [Shewanella sp. JNE10-2]UPO34423.1 DUF3363 domain-containing protein [Shewanella sp. JNE7]